ncbi:MAG: hypothetical protein ACPG7E_02705, partial [Marinirhabdus sp.]
INTLKVRLICGFYKHIVAFFFKPFRRAAIVKKRVCFLPLGIVFSIPLAVRVLPLKFSLCA